MTQVLQDIADMAVDFESSCGYSLPMFNIQCMFQLLIPVSLTGPASHLQKVCNNCQHDQINLNVGIVKGIT